MCASMWWCKSVTNGSNTMMIWSMKDLWECLVEEKRFLEEKPIYIKNIYYNSFNTKLSLVLILTIKVTKCVISLVHTNTRIGCIKKRKSIWSRLRRCYLSSLIFIYMSNSFVWQRQLKLDGVIKFIHFSVKCIHFLSNKFTVIRM